MVVGAESLSEAVGDGLMLSSVRVVNVSAEHVAVLALNGNNKASDVSAMAAVGMTTRSVGKRRVDGAFVLVLMDLFVNLFINRWTDSLLAVRGKDVGFVAVIRVVLA